jgi:CRISPR-associated endoribonuclease Cas6
LLFPEGRLVVESAARASGLPMPGLPAECLQPLRHALKTTEVSFGPFVLTGFTGWCEYRAAPAPELQALLRAMPYTGLGYKTAQGMGAVQVRPCQGKG